MDRGEARRAWQRPRHFPRPVPLPEDWLQMTGPAVVTAPDGTSGLLIINSERISGV